MVQRQESYLLSLINANKYFWVGFCLIALAIGRVDFLYIKSVWNVAFSEILNEENEALEIFLNSISAFLEKLKTCHCQSPRSDWRRSHRLYLSAKWVKSFHFWGDVHWREYKMRSFRTWN